MNININKNIEKNIYVWKNKYMYVNTNICMYKNLCIHIYIWVSSEILSGSSRHDPDVWIVAGVIRRSLDICSGGLTWCAVNAASSLWAHALPTPRCWQRPRGRRRPAWLGFCNKHPSRIKRPRWQKNLFTLHVWKKVHKMEKRYTCIFINTKLELNPYIVQYDYNM